MDVDQICHEAAYLPREGYRQVKPDLRGHLRSHLEAQKSNCHFQAETDLVYKESCSAPPKVGDQMRSDWTSEVIQARKFTLKTLCL